MSEIWFAFKCFAVTVLIVMLLQFKVGQDKLENNLTAYIESSKASIYLNEVAAGAVKSINELFAFVSDKAGFSSQPNNKHHRLKNFELSRSKTVEQDQ